MEDEINLLVRGNQKKLDALYSSSMYQPDSNKANYITNKAFESELNAWELATLAIIGSYNRYTDENEKLTTQPITKRLIFYALCLKMDNNYRNKKKLDKALDNLVEKGVITINYINESNHEMDRLMIVTQEFPASGNKEFTSLPFEDVEAITRVESDNERINLLAAYASVCKFIYHYDVRDVAEKINAAKKAVCYATQETIGSLYATSRTSVSRHLTQLVDLNVLAKYEVQLAKSKNGEITYYYSRYREVGAMKCFIIHQIKNGKVLRINVDENAMNIIRNQTVETSEIEQLETIVNEDVDNQFETITEPQNVITSADYFKQWFGVKRRLSKVLTSRLEELSSVYGEQVLFMACKKANDEVVKALKSKVSDKSISAQLNYITPIIDKYADKQMNDDRRRKRAEKALEQVNVDMSETESVYVSTSGA